MNVREIAQANAAVRDQMHSAASAVLHALIRNLHQKTDTRILLTLPPLDGHRVNYSPAILPTRSPTGMSTG